VPFCGSSLDFSGSMDTKIQNHFDQPSKFIRIIYLWCITAPYHPYPAQKGTKLQVSNLVVKASLNRSQELHNAVFLLVKMVDGFIEIVNNWKDQGKLLQEELLCDDDKITIGRIVEQITTGMNHLIFVACVREQHRLSSDAKCVNRSLL